MALTSVYYDGPVTETDRAQNRTGAPDYGVYGVNDFKVTAHPSIPYAVLVKAGKAHGFGVTDTAADDQVVQCVSLTTGQSRWDLIVVRRNWQPAAGGPSTLVAVQAGGVAAIPSTRKVGPGVEDDQPLFLVKWQGGTSAPVEFIDLRVWTGNGGLYAKSDLVRSYLTSVGTEVNINGVVWALTLGDNDLPSWKKIGVNLGTTYTPMWTGATNWGTGGYMTGTYWVDGDRVTVRAKVQAGSGASLGTGTIGFSLPAGYPIAAGTTLGTAVLSFGALRTLVAVASGANGCSVWAPTNPLSTPGAAGYPFAEGGFFEALITYQTTVS